MNLYTNSKARIYKIREKHIIIYRAYYAGDSEGVARAQLGESGGMHFEITLDQVLVDFYVRF